MATEKNTPEQKRFHSGAAVLKHYIPGYSPPSRVLTIEDIYGRLTSHEKSTEETP